MAARKERPPLSDLKPKDEAKVDPKARTKTDSKADQPNKVNSVKFSMKAIEKKPTRKYRKGSKYNAIIDAFVEGKNDLVTVNVKGKETNYIRTQLTKRAIAMDLGDSIKVSVVNNVCYLEKLK